MNTDWFLPVVRGRRGPMASLLRVGLASVSVPYRLGVAWRNRTFDRGAGTFSAAVPVASVGNLTLGGTGKTPCVEYLARFYADLGLRVVILSRGYGAERGRNDEAMVLEDNLPDVPHLQGKDRVQLAMTAVEELEADLLLLDDGFQHRRLNRDFDLVLVDATWPLSRERLFPRGTLREPVESLKRASAVLLTRCDQAPAAEPAAAQAAWIHARFPDMPIAFCEHRPTDLLGGDETLADLAGQEVAVFSGLGNPAAFRRTVEGLGATVVRERTFADHHNYTREDVADLNRWAESTGAALVLTAQKDWVKLRTPMLGGRPCRAVRVGLHFTGGETDLLAAAERIVPRE